jgi:poly(3-hydroxybutyrate) depolymerase
MNVGGLDRSYRLCIPAGLSSPAPLVVMMHGGFVSAQQAERAYGWDELADGAKFVVAYPDGVGRAWNVGGCCGRPGHENIDDVGFINALGISSGGMLAYALACNTGTFRRDQSRLGHPTRQVCCAAPDVGCAHPRHSRPADPLRRRSRLGCGDARRRSVNARPERVLAQR